MGDETVVGRHVDVCPSCVLVGMVLFGARFITCPRCLGTGVIVQWTEVLKELKELRKDADD